MDPIKIKGSGAVMEVFENKVVITPKGFVGVVMRGSTGSKTILFKSVTAIQFKKAKITKGFLQFSFSGGSESKDGIMDAMKDENSFTFDAAQNEEMEHIRQYIEERIGGGPVTSSPQSGGSIADELSRLHQLLKDGAISETEFRDLKQHTLKRSG